MYRRKRVNPLIKVSPRCWIRTICLCSDFGERSLHRQRRYSPCRVQILNKAKMILRILLLWFSCQCVFANNATIQLTTQSLLLYMDKLESRGEFEELSNICKERIYAHTVYYRILYFRFCNKITSPAKANEEFDSFCDNLQDYHNKEYRLHNKNRANLVDNIRNTAEKYETFGLGIENDHLFEAYITCVSIRDFHHQKLLIFRNDSKDGIQQPNYTEWFIHSVPFCLPVSCGFTKHTYYNKTPHPAILDCLPPSYKAALYILFCLDGLFVFATFLANILILIVVPKTNIAHTPHG